jgi:hypothetical protein
VLLLSDFRAHAVRIVAAALRRDPNSAFDIARSTPIVDAINGEARAWLPTAMVSCLWWRCVRLINVGGLLTIRILPCERSCDGALRHRACGNI